MININKHKNILKKLSIKGATKTILKAVIKSLKKLISKLYPIDLNKQVNPKLTKEAINNTHNKDFAKVPLGSSKDNFLIAFLVVSFFNFIHIPPFL